MGVVSSRFVNTSPLLKWICKLFNEPNGSLWQRILLKKYLPDGSLIFMSDKNGSQLLNGLEKIKHLFQIT